MKKEHYINYAGKELSFPAVVKISFAPVFDSLRKLSQDTDKSIAIFATTLLEEMKGYPILEEGFSDEILLVKYEKQIAKLLRVLFPDALRTNEIKGVTAPFQFTPFFKSFRFQNILNAAGEDYFPAVVNFSEEELYIFVCCIILIQVYHYNVDVSTAFKITIPDKEANIDRVYRIAFNAEMISAKATEQSPPITEEDFAMLIDRFTDIDLWKKKFPPGTYILSGIGIVNLMDVTVDQSIEGITTNLLVKSNTALEQITNHLKTIFKKPNLRIGYLNYESDFFISPPENKSHSILLENLPEVACSSELCKESYEKLIVQKKPLVIVDTVKYNERMGCQLSDTLIKQGIGSYIIIPLIYENDFLGFMELASENKYELSQASLIKLTEVLPVLSMALSHFKTEAKNEMDAVIQQEFTQIHPSVKWRFEEEAKKYIQKRRQGKEAVLHDMDFQNVYPLYGQLDIKGSSTIRNEVIQKDINAQLNDVKNILTRAYHKQQLPLYEELNFRIDTYIREIGSGLQAGSEHEVLHFLRKEINPVLEHLKKVDKGLVVSIKKYEALLDPQLLVIYNERKKFDESIALINRVLSDHLDKRQLDAQQMFPHYFERYKTDGIEYNIYAGASIAKDLFFDKIYIHNLRLWQLMVMSEMENEFNDIKKSLQEPLEIASLIMVHSDPLAIHFRLDEKRFDVKGAYNARYEIIKSRIDKALVKGTAERITVPGKLAIVYSNEQDADEYVRYINFLANKGYFKKGTIEQLELEDLQGITGLQALRVEIKYNSKMKEKVKLSVTQLMEAMQRN
ncbi:hypothetical protein BH11BAC4_BH11BAC4_02430 [soil metagenome]